MIRPSPTLHALPRAWLLLGAAGLACSGGPGPDTATDVTGASADKDPISISSAGDGVQGTFSIAVKPGYGAASVELGDGWSVRYTRFLVTLGELTAHTASGGSIVSTDAYLVDMLAAFPGDGTLLRLDEVEVNYYEDFSLTRPAGGALLAWNTTTADRKLMRDGGYSLYLEGALTQTAGSLCLPGAGTTCAPPKIVRFAWGIPIGTQFTGCPGFDVGADSPGEVTWTISGDRWFRTGFAADPEQSRLKGQWIADADLDRDGETTVDELRSFPASRLFTATHGYTLDDAPIPVDTAYDFLVAQAHMMGLDPANGCTAAIPTQ
jgi:hypothetical protein